MGAVAVAEPVTQVVPVGIASRRVTPVAGPLPPLAMTSVYSIWPPATVWVTSTPLMLSFGSPQKTTACAAAMSGGGVGSLGTMPARLWMMAPQGHSWTPAR